MVLHPEPFGHVERLHKPFDLQALLKGSSAYKNEGVWGSYKTQRL